MVFDFFRRAGADAIDDVEKTLVEMLHDARVVYDTASDAVFGGGKSKETKQAVRSTDREINISQMEVRRRLMIHASVSEGFELPLVLTYMSVVKDVERVGDYAKNLYDLAKYGVDFTEADDFEALDGYREAVGQLIDDAADTFAHRDRDRAERLIAKADGFLADYEEQVKAAYRSEGPAGGAVARALYYRFLKRITAHIMNLMTALVMPIDQLDYYDEAPEDR